MIDSREMIKAAQPGDFNATFSKIAAAIGAENALKVCQICGGRKLRIPKEDALVTPIRRRMIVKEYAAGGVTQVCLADKYGVSLRTVQSYVKTDKST